MGRGPDVVIECAGPSAAFKDGLEIVRRGGRFLVIGQTDPTPISIVPSTINLRNIDIIGVAAATIAHSTRRYNSYKTTNSGFPFSISSRTPIG